METFRRTLVYDVPLADGHMVQLLIPADLSAAECKRLQDFLASLIVPWRSEPQTPPT